MMNRVVACTRPAPPQRPIWNASGIDNVQITIAETVGLEDRASYYDGAGALRDMVANHMLQLLALIAPADPSGLLAPLLDDPDPDVRFAAARAIGSSSTINTRICMLTGMARPLPVVAEFRGEQCPCAGRMGDFVTGGE